MWVLNGTHVQCMGFVNVCYKRNTVYEMFKTVGVEGDIRTSV